MALRRSRAFKATPDLWLYLQKAVDSGKRGKGLGDYVESAPYLHRAISDVHFGCSLLTLHRSPEITKVRFP